MIEVFYDGRLGNNLFQYCLGRILADRLGFALKADPIANFDGTAQPIDGASHFEPIQVLTGHTVDFSSIVENAAPRRIQLRGFFQDRRLYAPHRPEICRWLRFPRPLETPTEHQIVVHVRRSDYVGLAYHLPFHYYSDAILRSGCKHVVIVTDDRHDPFFKRFREFRPTYFQGNAFQSFCYLASARHLVLSQSSYSWWASFLGSPDQVFAPIPRQGPWARDEIDLLDPAKFELIRCAESEQPTAAERWYHKHWVQLIMHRIRNPFANV